MTSELHSGHRTLFCCQRTEPSSRSRWSPTWRGKARYSSGLNVSTSKLTFFATRIPSARSRKILGGQAVTQFQLIASTWATEAQVMRTTPWSQKEKPFFCLFFRFGLKQPFESHIQAAETLSDCAAGGLLDTSGRWPPGHGPAKSRFVSREIGSEPGAIPAIIMVGLDRPHRTPGPDGILPEWTSGVPGSNVVPHPTASPSDNPVSGTEAPC